MHVQRTVRMIAWCTLGIAFNGSAGIPLEGQSVDLDEYDLCAECIVTTELVTRLGEGPLAESFIAGAVAPLANGGYVVAPVGSTRASLHSPDGSLTQFIGRDGQGPGEFLSLGRVGVVGDTVLLSDLQRGRLIRYLASGEFLDEVLLSPADGLFVPVGGRVIVMARSDRSPSRVGRPLHRVDLEENGGDVQSFGGDGRAFDLDDPLLNRFVIASARSQEATTFLFGRHGELAVEAWNSETMELEVRYEASPDWFGGAGTVFDGRSPPPPILVDVAIDGDGRLWVMTRVADPDWEDSVEVGPSVHGYRVTDFDGIRDVRIDVYDIPNRRFIEGMVFDMTRMGFFVDAEGEPFLYRSFVDEVSGLESATVSRLQLSRAESG